MEPLDLGSTTVPLHELLRRFNSGEYQLPAFQRPFVWRIRQTLNLLDSLVRGYPIGVVYLWEPAPTSKLQAKKRTFKATNGLKEVDRFKAFVIDGQQRLTSLNAAFGMSEAFDAVNGKSLECWLELICSDKRDGRVTTLFQSPAQKKFLAEERAQQQPWRVRLGDLLTVPHQQLRQDRVERLRSDQYADEDINRATTRIDAAYRMLNTPITCITITRSDDEEVLSVFKRLNRGGTGLKERDVRAADLGIGKSVDVLQDIQSFVQQPLPVSLGFGFSFAFRALVVFHRGTAQFSQLPANWADVEGDRRQTIRDSWHEASKSLTAAMKIVDGFGWSRRPLLPSCNALIPLAFAINRLGRQPSSSARDLILRWYCLAALRGVFKGGVEVTINKHLRNIKDARDPMRGLLSSLTANQSRPIKPDEMMREPTTLWGPFSQVMFAWLVSQNAKDWLSGQPLAQIARLGHPMQRPEETLTIQHIFPRKLLADQEYAQEEANYPANFAIIGRGPNSSLGDLPPCDAIQRLDSHERREYARVQFFSTDVADLLLPARYGEFLDWRAKRLSEAWNDWLKLKG